MTQLLLSLLLAVPACAEKDRFKTIGVEALAAALASADAPVVYDANNAETREGAGVVPGARLLASYKYDAAKELPADKKKALVFYCANEMCMASHKAAEAALDAGHTDVSVMTAGIFGWRKAGQPCAPAPGKARALAPKAVSALVARKGAVVVDVREAEERFSVVPGARSAPMSGLRDDKGWAAFVASLPKDKAVVFHCAMGMRAKKASERLAAQGFSTGYFDSPDQWKAAGLPVEKGPAR